jgi:hypothetical protein
MYVRRRTNHPLHAVLTIGTCGIWLFVWVPVGIYNWFQRDRVYHEHPPVYMAGQYPPPQTLPPQDARWVPPLRPPYTEGHGQ